MHPEPSLNPTNSVGGAPTAALFPELIPRFSPAQGTFSGHETFPFRYAWLKKGLEGLISKPALFNSDDAVVDLGVGKNMVRSIRHWCIATRVLEEGVNLPGSRTKELQASTFGKHLLLDPGWDAYLEDDASLWLLHWNLATNEKRATTWYWAFNHLKEHEFTVDGLTEALDKWLSGYDVKVSASSLRNDVSCLTRTYAAVRRGPGSTAEETLECPLTNLGLLSEVPGEKRYRFHSGQKTSLPSAIFAYALLDFWRKRHAFQQTLSVREITHGEGSPGRVFRLDDDAVLGYLDDLDQLTQGRLSFSDTVLIRQVIRRSETEPQELLHDYYAA